MTDFSAPSTWRKHLMAASRLRIIALFCLSLCIAFTHTLVFALGPEGHQQAQRLAEATGWISTGIQPRTHSQKPHALGIQTLSIEIRETKDKQAPPVLKVYQYHYELMQARVLSIDPVNRSVLRTQPIQSVHLPLNPIEIEYASGLLQQNTFIIEQLRNEQLKRGKTAFNLLSELDVKASIHEPHDTAHACSRQRCALLSLFDDSRTVFSVEPVINLQTGQVGSLETQ